MRGTILTRFLPPELREGIVRNSASLGEIVPASMCAGDDYPTVARGGLDFIAYWRGLPWDHAPGALFLTEAGGSVTRYDGSEFQPDGKSGVLAASNADIADTARATLRLA